MRQLAQCLMFVVLTAVLASAQSSNSGRWPSNPKSSTTDAGGPWLDYYPEDDSNNTPARTSSTTPQRQQTQDSSLDQACRSAYQYRNRPAALSLCSRAASAGSLDAQAMLGLVYFDMGRYVEAARTMEPVVHRDRILAYDLAMIYYHGSSGKLDLCRARALFTEAAQKGHAISYSQLGYLDDLGTCGTRNRSRAIADFDQATRLGDRHTAAFAHILRDPRTPVFHSLNQMIDYLGNALDPCLSPSATPVFKQAYCGIPMQHSPSGPIFTCSDGMQIGRPCVGN